MKPSPQKLVIMISMGYGVPLSELKPFNHAKAQGEVIAADNMGKAADILAASPGALHLRTLQSINDLSSDQSNTVVVAMPLEILRAFEGFNKPKKTL